MYWFIVAALVILNIIAALWAITGIRRERLEYREGAAGRHSPRAGRRAASDKRRGGYRNDAAMRKSSGAGGSAAEDGSRVDEEREGEKGRALKYGPEESGAPHTSGKRRWKVVLENISSGEISDHMFYRSTGIGRAEKSTAFEDFISIPYDRRISKIHCSILVSGDSLYLKDENSTNHTYLNGRKINKPETLKKGDMISIGETEIRVVKILRETL